MEMYNRAYKLDPEVESHFSTQDLNAHLKESAARTGKNEDELYNPFVRASTTDHFDPHLTTDIKAALAAATTEKAPEPRPKASVNVLRISSEAPNDLLQTLPDDVLMKVLQSLGRQHLPSLEAGIARCSRQLYLACRQDELWSFLAAKKQLLHLPDSLSPREAFIAAPQFRTDGLYISKITYIRQGWEEGAANPPSFVVTYYRYLRFFCYPKRFVLALVSTEKPSAVIERLRSVPEQLASLLHERFFSPNNRHTEKRKKPSSAARKGPTADLTNFFIGSFWPDPSIAKSDDDPVADLSRYFRLLLFDCTAANPMRLQMNMRVGDPQRGVSSRTARCFGYAGRVEYFTLATATEREPGERVEFDVHNWGKFYFSRVKRYLT